MTTDLVKRLREAYLAGFNASGEGYNGEYPYGDNNRSPEDDEQWCKSRDERISALEARDGWVLVPREPTNEMCTAGWHAHITMQAHGGSGWECAASVYRAMLSAAQEQNNAVGQLRNTTANQVSDSPTSAPAAPDAAPQVKTVGRKRGSRTQQQRGAMPARQKRQALSNFKVSASTCKRR